MSTSSTSISTLSKTSCSIVASYDLVVTVYEFENSVKGMSTGALVTLETDDYATVFLAAEQLNKMLDTVYKELLEEMEIEAGGKALNFTRTFTPIFCETIRQSERQV